MHITDRRNQRQVVDEELEEACYVSRLRVWKVRVLHRGEQHPLCSVHLERDRHFRAKTQPVDERLCEAHADETVYRIHFQGQFHAPAHAEQKRLHVHRQYRRLLFLRLPAVEHQAHVRPKPLVRLEPRIRVWVRRRRFLRRVQRRAILKDS